MSAVTVMPWEPVIVLPPTPTGLYFKLCAAQNIHGRERFDLFKSVCKKYIDHNKSSSFSLIS